MVMEWTDAIRKHAQMTGGKYRIPKKGTAEYDAVKKLQASGGGGVPSRYTEAAAAAAPAADKKAAKKAKKAAVKTEAMEGVAKGVYTAEAGKGVSFKAKGLPAIQLKRKVRSDKKAVVAAEAKVMPKNTHLKFDDEGKEKKPRKVRSDKGKKRGPRKAKEE
jgi:hypothetical protein